MTEYWVNELGPDDLGGDNNYKFEASTALIATLEEELTFRTATATSPGVPGRVAFPSLFDVCYLTLAGNSLGSDVGALRTIHDNFKNALINKQATYLYLDDDRRCMVYLADSISVEKTKGMQYRNWSVRLACYDNPPFRSLTAETGGVPVGTTNDIVMDGSGPSYPTFSIVITGFTTGANSQVVLQNSANSQSFAFIPSIVGTYVIDMFNRSVTVGGVDYKNTIVPSNSKPMLLLPSVTNSIDMTLGDGITTDGTSTVSYYNGWY